MSGKMPGKMDKVAAVAQIAEQKSARELGTSQQDHQRKCVQLDQLKQFKADYELTLEQKGSEGMPAKQLQDYRLFLGRLNQAIDQQVREIQDSEVSLVAVQARWLSKSQRKSALDHLVDERHRVQVKSRDKAEQKASDEHMMHRRSMGNDS